MRSGIVETIFPFSLAAAAAWPATVAVSWRRYMRCKTRFSRRTGIGRHQHSGLPGFRLRLLQLYQPQHCLAANPDAPGTGRCGRTIAGESLTGLYNTETVIAVRIDRLVSGGHLIERDGRYYSGKWRFLLVARTFDLLPLGDSLADSAHRKSHDSDVGVDLVGHRSQARLSHPTPLNSLLAVEEGTELDHEPVSQLNP